MFEFVIVIFMMLVLVSLWSISQSLEKIAKDLRIISGRDGSKPPAGDLEQRIDA